jgi:glycosyltransferase involved in cell wall biosynthesis
MLRLIIKARGYDILHGYGSGTAYLPFCGKPFFATSTGSDLRELAVSGGFIGKLQMSAYKKAKIIFFGPDEENVEILKKNGLLDKSKVAPILFDYLSFTPGFSALRRKYGKKFIVFNASMLNWQIKGTYLIVNAFAEFAKREKDAFLILIGWGPDVEKTKMHLHALKLDGKAEVIGRQSKQELLGYYRLADVVTDQFKIGALGNSSREALACGKPLITRLDEKLFKAYYYELPPILNAKSEDDIVAALKSSTPKEEGRVGQGRPRLDRAALRQPKDHTWSYIRIFTVPEG